MTATSDLQTVSGMLRKIHRQRWVEDGILDHVVIRLPAPIFDCLVREVQHELDPIQAAARGFDPRATVDHFKFDGIKFERIDGVYWSVKARAADL